MCIDVIIVVAIVIVYFTYPETSKVTLEEVSTIFDGKNAVKNELFKEQQVMEAVKTETDNKNVVVEHEVVA